MKKIILVFIVALALSGCAPPGMIWENCQSIRDLEDCKLVHDKNGQKYKNEYKRLRGYCDKFGDDIEMEVKFVSDYYPNPRDNPMWAVSECLVNYNGNWINRYQYENRGIMNTNGDDNGSFISGYIIGGINK